MVSARSGLFLVINIILSIFAFLIYNVSSTYNVPVNVDAVNSSDILFNNASIYVKGQGTRIFTFDQVSYVPIDQFKLSTINSISSLAIPSGGYIVATSEDENKISFTNSVSGSETFAPTSSILSKGIFDGFGTLYFCDSKNGNLISIDAQTLIQTGSYYVGKSPNDISSLIRDNQVIVSLQGEKSVGIFDLVSKTVKKIPVGDANNSPMKIFYYQPSKMLWVLNNKDLIDVVDLSGKKVKTTLKIPSASSSGKEDYVDFSVDDASVYLLSTDGTVSVLDIASKTLIKSFGTIVKDAVCLNYKNNLLYILSSSNNMLTAYELEGRLVYDFSSKMK